MEQIAFIKNIIKANFHKGGIKCLRLYKMKIDFYSNLKREVLKLAKENQPSDVRNKDHISHEATRPYGENFQYSLFNETGRFNDPSKDWNRTGKNKKFHHADKYSYIASFINAFPGITNMKLLVLGPNSGLYPHEAHIIHPEKNKKKLILRFHLPIKTNNHAEMLLDNDFFRFEEQFIYFFNEGCIHSAYNHGTESRYHLSWDMCLSQEVFDLMFSDIETVNDLMKKMIGIKKDMVPHKHERINAYELQGNSKIIYEKLRLKKIGLQPGIYNKIYNEIAYVNFKIKEKEIVF
jgi:hypothetical protein